MPLFKNKNSSSPPACPFLGPAVLCAGHCAKDFTHIFSFKAKPTPWFGCGRRSDTPFPSKNVHGTISRTCDYVMLWCQGYFRWQMEWRLLNSWPWNGELLLDDEGGLNVLMRISKWGRRRQDSVPVMWHEKDSLVMAGFEDKVGHEPRDAGTSGSWRRRRHGLLPQAPPKPPERNTALMIPGF